MNGHDLFEQRLRRQPLRPVPPAWREEILVEAKAAVAAQRQEVASKAAAEDRAALVAGWRLLFARLPLAWASLAALWVALIGVNLMMPSPMVRMAEPSAPASQMEALAALDSEAVGFDPVTDPFPPVPAALPATRRPEVPIRPRSERRRNLDCAVAGSDTVLNHLA